MRKADRFRFWRSDPACMVRPTRLKFDNPPFPFLKAFTTLWWYLTLTPRSRSTRALHLKKKHAALGSYITTLNHKLLFRITCYNDDGVLGRYTGLPIDLRYVFFV